MVELGWRKSREPEVLSTPAGPLDNRPESTRRCPMGNSITIPLPCGCEAIVDAEDWPVVSAYRWYATVGNNGVRYATAYVPLPDGRQAQIRMHRLILKPKPTEEIDHENRNGLDCRRSNMRIATRVSNAGNRVKHANGQSPYKGVVFERQRCARPWAAYIDVNGVKRRLGSFDAANDAAEAYDRAARVHFGEFARVNFPMDGEEGALVGIAPEEINRRVAYFESIRRTPGKPGRKPKDTAPVRPRPAKDGGR